MQNSDYAPAKRRRRPKGQLYSRKLKSGSTSYGVRFMVGGERHYRTIGSSIDGWTAKKARAEIDRLMALVFVGEWDPAAEEEERVERTVPTFGEFAEKWYERRRRKGGRRTGGLSERSIRDLREWRLDGHVFPFFASLRLDEITAEAIDDYEAAKLGEGVLSAASINKMISTIASILDLAVAYGHVDRNVAKGHERLAVERPTRTYLDTPEQIVALLDAAASLDRGGRGRPYRRALLATLTFAGLRIGEALDLEWRDVDLGAGWLAVRGTKTDAAERRVKIRGALRDELDGLVREEPGDLVFATRTGGGFSASNVRNRILAPAVERANVALAEAGERPIPEGLTPHGLRRTFASILAALPGMSPPRLMREMGHADPKLTFTVYAQVMEDEDGALERLAALIEPETPEVRIAVEMEVEEAA